MKERPRPGPPALIEQLELLTAEARNCDLEERSGVLAELHQEQDALHKWEDQAEAFNGVPDFWGDIYGQGHGLLSLFSGIRHQSKLTNPRSAYFSWPAETSAAMRWLEWGAVEGRELYQCGHLLNQPRRRKDTAAPLWALYVDLDAGHIPDTFATPSIVVQSSPGRLQCYWRLNSPIAASLAEAINRSLGRAVGADKSGWDLTQLLRVPGSRNHKYPDAPVVRVLAATDRSYTLDELLSWLPPLPPATETPTAAPPLPLPSDIAWLPEQLSATAQRMLAGQGVKQTPDGRVDRSAALVQLARILHGAGLSRALLIAALAERDAALGWRKYSDRRDAAHQYQAIADLVGAERS